MKIKTIIKRPEDITGHVVYLENDNETIQNVVGGYYTMVKLASDLAVLCNEEGMIHHLPYNCSLFGQHFFGTLMFVGLKDGDFADYPGDFDHYKRCIIGGDL